MAISPPYAHYTPRKDAYIALDLEAQTSPESEAKGVYISVFFGGLMYAITIGLLLWRVL